MQRQDMRVDIEERWKNIDDFSDYDISDRGRVYNVRFNSMMRTSINQFGHVKITLTSEYGQRLTRSVAQLVAEAFIERPSFNCTHVVMLDGDLTNLDVENLVWRPSGYAWHYRRQLVTPQPLHFRNLHVVNVKTGDIYSSIVEAGMREGLLFTEIWKSTWSAVELFPFNAVFEVIQDRV